MSSRNILISEDMPEVNITGGAIATTPHNIHLFVYNDEIEKNGDFVKNNVNLVKKGKVELVMSSDVAEDIANLILKEIRKDNLE